MKLSHALISAVLTIQFLPAVVAAQDSPAPPTLFDSNDTRLFFAPTGRPLQKGQGYFSDHMLVFPGVTYGITDNLSISGGMSVVPGLGLDEQIFYVAPKLGKRFSEDLSVSGGLLYGYTGAGHDGEGLGVGYAIATLGKPTMSLSLGAGALRTAGNSTPVLMVGGTARLSSRVALVSENWLILNEDFKLAEQPFSLGVRFMGDRLSADVGFVLVGEWLDEGFPLPWVSVSYRFGRAR
jgi:hypothetical protein